MLARLIYRSTANSADGADMPGIFESSQRNNREVGITGALGLLRGTYMQYLEGEEAAIECVMAAISEDRRHANLKVVEYRFIAARAFPGWSMARIAWTQETQAILKPLADMGLCGIQPSVAAPVFRSMTRGSIWSAYSGANSRPADC